MSFHLDAQRQLNEAKQYHEQGRLKDAARCLHTLKGLASTVGANDLAAGARELEFRLKNSPVEPEALLQPFAQLDALLQQALQAIAVMPSQVDVPDPLNAGPGADTGADATALRSALNELLALLQANNMRSLAYCAQFKRDHAAQLTNTQSEQLQALDGAVNQLAFAKAIPLCCKLIEEIA